MDNNWKPDKNLVAEMSQYDSDVEQLGYDNPGKRIFIVYESQRLCLRILCRNSNDLDEITSNFREIDTSSFYTQRFSSKSIENYRYSVSPFGYFQPGLLRDLLEFLKTNSIVNPFGEPLSCFVCISSGVMRFMNEWLFPLNQQIKQLQAKGDIEISNISEDRCDTPMSMRDYQEEAINSILTKGFGRGLIESATGSGKSFIIANFIYTLKNLSLPKKDARVLIYVPNIQLVEQFYSDLLSYGYKKEELCKCSGALTRLRDKEWMKNHCNSAWIVIANSGWCNNHISELGNIDVLIIDEAHRCTPGSKGFNNLREFLFHTKVRVGFTGTLPKKYALWELEGLLGPILYKASITTLQGMGYLADLAISKINIRDKIVDDEPNYLFNIHSKWKLDEYREDTGVLVGANDAWIEEQDWCTDNCNRIYAPVINLMLADAKTPNMNTLVLFDRIVLGQNLFSLLEVTIADNNLGDKIKPLYIDGSTEVSIREKVRSDLETSNGNILLGQSAILSTGINIKNLSRIVLLSAGKAQARIIQAIGRTLRLNKGKTMSELVDIELSYKYSKRHAAERKLLYKQWYNKSKFDQILEFEV